jgi:hypothetical protein
MASSRRKIGGGWIRPSHQDDLPRVLAIDLAAPALTTESRSDPGLRRATPGSFATSPVPSPIVKG